MGNPFRGWFTAYSGGEVLPPSRLRTIGDVTDGRHPEHPTTARPALSKRCDRCGHEPMVVLWHGFHGELDLCGHDADALVDGLESGGWIVVLDHRQSTADKWRKVFAR